MTTKLVSLLTLLLLTGCEPAAAPAPGEATLPRFQVIGKLQSEKIDEASGIQAGNGGVYFVHNDEGTRIYAVDEGGRDLGDIKIKGASNRDWEDITRVIGDEGPLLVIADVGDNLQSRKKVSLYFIREPAAGSYSGKQNPAHRVDVRYPDGPRDVEAVAYDSFNDMILFMSKRDQPPRLYGVPLDLALWEQEVEAIFLAEVPVFRPPTRLDILRNPKRGMWVSQPTGMDISADGRTAAVITYRSLYLFERKSGESWAEAFQRTPVEYPGPPGLQEEAVAFGHEPGSIIVTTEGRPAPVYKLEP
ncbi:MAG: hypothetical protein HKN57_04250 [Xanthomonadales bacterium]|nr:hypothetical protein [Gammaproteobacteria bacterium]MBT8054394.1 hypothetical protein [Gammaproteobacteria bacterium]NND56442.1 hypothetical protein [Xanthomonadales bacterium]NNK51137.1 hypothetical protein [Xanthomonadales bacterium]